jgi:formiminotetrahydrofolate cyclodeaminase
MSEASLTAIPLPELLANVAAKSPTPGGGAVAAATGALAAALASMVVSYSIGKKSLAHAQPQLEEDQVTLVRTRLLFLELADEDARAYAELNRLSKLPENHPERTTGYAKALTDSVRAPMTIVATSLDLLRRLEAMTTRTNQGLRSDLAIAAVLAHAAAESGAWNVRINTPGLPASERDAADRELAHYLEDSAARRRHVEKACAV